MLVLQVRSDTKRTCIYSSLSEFLYEYILSEPKLAYWNTISYIYILLPPWKCVFLLEWLFFYWNFIKNATEWICHASFFCFSFILTSLFSPFSTAILGLFCLFWLQLDMFTTLRYLFMVGVVTFFSGNSMLSNIAANRKEWVSATLAWNKGMSYCKGKKCILILGLGFQGVESITEGLLGIIVLGLKG